MLHSFVELVADEVTSNQTIVEDTIKDVIGTMNSMFYVVLLIPIIFLLVSVLMRSFSDASNFGESSVDVKSESDVGEPFEWLTTSELGVTGLKCGNCGSHELVEDHGELFRCAYCGHRYKVRHEVKKTRMVR